MTQIADELKSNDIDGAHCLECQRVEQVSLLYFSIFDFFALCCCFGGSGSGGAGWNNYHVGCSDCVGDSDVPSGAVFFTPRDWCQSIRSLPVWSLWFLNGITPNQVIYNYSGRCALLGLSLQEKAWVPRVITLAPQMRLSSWPSSVPRRMPTATRSASSVKRNPQAEMSIADSQSPLWAAEAASSLARW